MIYDNFGSFSLCEIRLDCIG